jgi:hypothetical protein
VPAFQAAGPEQDARAAATRATTGRMADI